LVLAALALGAVVMLLGRVLEGTGGRVYFCVLGALAVAGAVRVVTHPRPVYSALYFVMVVLSTAALMVLAGAEFLAAALVIVYAGAILVTYVFVIMLAQPSPTATAGRFGPARDYDRHAREPAAAVMAAFLLTATVAGVIAGRSERGAHLLGASGSHASPAISTLATDAEATPQAGIGETSAATEGNTLRLGRVLLTDFAVSVELAGVLLMVAMVGAIVLARKRIPLAEEEVPAPPPGEIGRGVEPF
jgi:NADH-quinone oxidoreductase subunit J